MFEVVSHPNQRFSVRAIAQPLLNGDLQGNEYWPLTFKGVLAI